MVEKYDYDKIDDYEEFDEEDLTRKDLKEQIDRLILANQIIVFIYLPRFYPLYQMLKYEVLGGKKTDTAQDRRILIKAMNAYIIINLITFFVLVIIS